MKNSTREQTHPLSSLSSPHLFDVLEVHVVVHHERHDELLLLLAAAHLLLALEGGQVQARVLARHGLPLAHLLVVLLLWGEGERG